MASPQFLFRRLSDHTFVYTDFAGDIVTTSCIFTNFFLLKISLYFAIYVTIWYTYFKTGFHRESNKNIRQSQNQLTPIFILLL